MPGKTVAARTAFLGKAYRFPGPHENVGAQLLNDTNALPPLPHSRSRSPLNAASGRPFGGGRSRRLRGIYKVRPDGTDGARTRSDDW